MIAGSGKNSEKNSREDGADAGCKDQDKEQRPHLAPRHLTLYSLLLNTIQCTCGRAE